MTSTSIENDPSPGGSKKLIRISLRRRSGLKASVKVRFLAGAMMTALAVTMASVKLSGRELASPMPSPPPARTSADQAAELQPLPRGLKKVKHIIWIMQENRTFDNYFGTFQIMCLTLFSPGGRGCC